MIALIAVLASGAIGAVIYFGGLWLTARHFVAARRGSKFAFASWLARIVMLGAIFYLMARRSEGDLLVGFTSFWFTRLYLIRRLGGRSYGI
jgi:F1F0 ATPase subunit 2